MLLNNDNYLGGGRSKLKNPTRRSELIQPASNGYSKEEPAPEPAMPPPKQVDSMLFLFKRLEFCC